MTFVFDCSRGYSLIKVYVNLNASPPTQTWGKTRFENGQHLDTGNGYSSVEINFPKFYLGKILALLFVVS